MDGVNIEKNEKKDALLIAIEEGRTIEKESQQNTLLLTLFCKYDLKNGTPLNQT